MFPGSEIAKTFCKKTLIWLLILKIFLESLFYVLLFILFDECFDKLLQKTHLNIVVMCMNHRRVSSAFLGRCTANEFPHD